MSKNKLINRKNKSQLIEDLKNENFKRKTYSFYRYVKIKDPQYMRTTFLKEWSKLNILGRVYIANEGINAQISVPESLRNDFILSLDKYKEFSSMYIKSAVLENKYSFLKLIIRVKNKIVADGLNNSKYNSVYWVCSMQRFRINYYKNCNE